jgi:type IV pilus assembly protein PilB
LVNTLIIRALEKRATDIHLEPLEDNTKVRYRIDGILFDIVSLPKEIHPPCVSRIKIISNMNLAEKRLPQDGRFKVRYQQRPIDFRVSTIPTIFGEKVAIRILDRERVPLKLENLGFDKETLEEFRKALYSPNGIILVTGPTGSGKTTTLYSILTELHSVEVNITTLEDPVEYNLPGINQIQINPKIGLNFENGLEAILRQDPDIIMVGEIRSFKSAQTAIRAALTGHLILSTLHTNNAPEAVVRLLDMGVESYLLASSLVAVIAQRIVRKICQNCKAPIEIPDKIFEYHRIGEIKDVKFYFGQGCSRCNYTGYFEQTAVFEFLRITDRLKELISANAPITKLTYEAIKEGMKTLRQSSLEKVKQGITTLEEVLEFII